MNQGKRKINILRDLIIFSAWLTWLLGVWRVIELGDNAEYTVNRIVVLGALPLILTIVIVELLRGESDEF